MRKHIVIIEQNTSLLVSMKDFLENEGYVVTGFDAFPSMTELALMRADCMIINEWLPDVSGHAICLMLKAKVLTSSVPVILISTSHVSIPVANLGEADAVLKSPFEMLELLPAISSVIANRVLLSKTGHV
jgi:DNA-binding response OmpR family regulator